MYNPSRPPLPVIMRLVDDDTTHNIHVASIEAVSWTANSGVVHLRSGKVLPMSTSNAKEVFRVWKGDRSIIPLLGSEPKPLQPLQMSGKSRLAYSID